MERDRRQEGGEKCGPGAERMVQAEGSENAHGRYGCKSAYETYKRFARTNTRRGAGPRAQRRATGRKMTKERKKEKNKKKSESRKDQETQEEDRAAALVPMDSNENKYL